MSEHQRETAFLRHCLRYHDSAEHRALDEDITQIQRDDRCVKRAVWLMAMVTVLAAVGLGYAAVLMDSFPWDTSRPVVKSISGLGLAATICLVAFVALRIVYRLKLNHRRETGRQLVRMLLKSRLGQPVPAPAQPQQNSSGSERKAGIDRVATEHNVLAVKPESTAQG